MLTCHAAINLGLGTRFFHRRCVALPVGGWTFQFHGRSNKQNQIVTLLWCRPSAQRRSTIDEIVCLIVISSEVLRVAFLFPFGYIFSLSWQVSSFLFLDKLSRNLVLWISGILIPNYLVILDMTWLSIFTITNKCLATTIVRYNKIVSTRMNSRYYTLTAAKYLTANFWPFRVIDFSNDNKQRTNALRTRDRLPLSELRL